MNCLQAILRKTIIKKGNEAWDKLKNDTDLSKNPTLVWRVAKSIITKSLPISPSITLKKRGVMTTDPEKVAVDFLNFFANICQQTQNETPKEIEDEITAALELEDTTGMSFPFTFNELLTAIAKIKSQSTGIDNIHNKMLKRMSK